MMPRTFKLAELTAVVLLLGAGPATADEPRDADRKAVREAMTAFAGDFAGRDADALAGRWTAEGEYRHEEGESLRGRDAIRSAFARYFAETPEVSARVEPEGTRFLGRDTAVDEGTVTVQRGATGSATRAHYQAMMVREDGRWLIAQLVESPVGGPAIEDLGWLVGEWETSAGQGATIRTSYTWAPGRKFLQARFSLAESELDLSGMQVLGVDPATGQLHTWTFEADGGVGEADWTPDGDHWVLNASGTLPDGRSMVETNILRRIDDDTFTWQSVDRSIDDEPIADLAPVRVTRVRPAARPAR